MTIRPYGQVSIQSRAAREYTMFDNLSGKFTKALRFLKGETKLTDDNTQ
jgi:hypothetical protein